LYLECPSGTPRPSHFDLMLEANGVLRTWAIAGFPSSWGATAVRSGFAAANLPSSVSENIVAEQLPDHRLAYLDYEGPLNGDRGHVSRFDAGTLTTVSESADEWIVALSGQRIRGQLQLTRIAADSPRWQLTFQAAVR
jgi:hypothetical protein